MESRFYRHFYPSSLKIHIKFRKIVLSAKYAYPYFYVSFIPMKPIISYSLISFPSAVLSIHGIVVAINDFVQILGDDLRHPLQLLEVKAPFDHEGGQSDGR